MGCWCIDIDVIIRERIFLINLIFENNGAAWIRFVRGLGGEGENRRLGVY